jgi:hypothetical protein
MPNVTYKYWDDSAKSLALDLFKRTGQRTSPWRLYPERETYTEWRKSSDGSCDKRTVSTWAGQVVTGEWTPA